MEAGAPRSVGLVGDGDEIAAIEHVEQAFGVALDERDAPSWRTAGDLFASLRKALPPDAAGDAAGDAAAWARFAEALALETGLDPGLIVPDSPLLLPDKGLWGGVKEGCVANAGLWLILLLAALVF